MESGEHGGTSAPAPCPGPPLRVRAGTSAPDRTFQGGDMEDLANNLPSRRDAGQPSLQRQSLVVVGLLLLVAWAVYWGASLYQGKVFLTSHSWVPGWDFVGLDFL